MDDEPGSIVQRRKREIRTEGATVPLQFDELEETAVEKLPSAVSDFVVATAGPERNLRTNREGFDRWRIVPRVFRDVTERSLEIDLFEESLPTPLLVAPIGGQTMYHEEGELAVARASSSLGVPFTLSTGSSHSIEEVAQEVEETPSLFQLYWTADWEITASLLARAEAVGYDGVLLTVDSQAPRWMPRNISTDGTGLISTRKANFTTDPVANLDSGESVESDRSVTWEDLEFLRGQTELPIYVKGILHPDDAKQAVTRGADGIVVSNHGGRQLDGEIGAIDALPEIVAVVDEAVPVLFDSGIRNGADAFKALALGANAVFLGRPSVYGLSLGGERGVYEVIHNVLAELDSVVGQAGFSSVAEIDENALRRSVRPEV